MASHGPSTVNDQLQARLFSKLSPEIRSMIWREIILNDSSYDILHIISRDNSTRHIQCNAPEDGYNASKVARALWGTEHEHCYFFSGIGDDTKTAKQRRISPLILSYQRLYLETKGLLYSIPTFSLIGPIAASRFLSTISPHSRDSIRRLIITWMPERYQQEEIAVWKKTWGLIRAMPSLRSIRVALYDCYSWNLEEQLLAPLMECKIKDFVVDLPWHGQGKEYVDPPFLIVRPKPGEEKMYSVIDMEEHQKEFIYPEEPDSPFSGLLFD